MPEAAHTEDVHKGVLPDCSTGLAVRAPAELLADSTRKQDIDLGAPALDKPA